MDHAASALSVRTLSGEGLQLGAASLDELQSRLHGSLVFPGSPGFDEARQIWNAMIDRRPGLIVRCADAADVAAAVTFAALHRLLVSVRGGGHNIAGSAICDGGMMIDLSAMRAVEIDPSSRAARVQPGATLAEFDQQAQAFGLATPLGINSTTGVAGLTLGGGFGWLTRAYGMTVDNLIGADVVTATGEAVRASAQENPDLFWAIRGGSGNFGIVTSFEFQLHPVGPEVFAGLIVHPFEHAGELLRRYRAFAEQSPDELSCWVVLRKAPPLPFLPPEIHGREVVVFALCYAGEAAAGAKAIEPLLAFGEPVGSHVGQMPYAAWQAAFDPLLTAGMRNYWKSHNFAALPDEALDLLVEHAGQLPTPHCEIIVAQLGGAASRVAAAEMAYPHRDTRYVLNVHTRWEDPADDQACIGWARRFFDATAPHATGGVYVNFITEDEERVAAAYGGNYGRLVAAKRRYDPGNLFRMNQNIPTAGDAVGQAAE